MIFKIVYIAVFLLSVFISVSSKAPIVETTHGKVTGKVLKTLFEETEYYGFMGIPYAAPPVDDFRFLPPQPVQPWTDALPATKEKQACIQFNMNVKKGQRMGQYGVEDCLYLDIFTPQPDDRKRPVIVFLYNEYFRYSYNKTKDYAPDFFIDEDVVIATLSHRLSVFGFLSFEDETLSGNSGLKDIVAGLEWIKSNVERFGGDPNRITLMGSQGGAAAIDLLMHSTAKNLFDSVILQGGTSWSSGFLQDGSRERAFKLGELLETGSKNSAISLRRLTEIPADKILKKVFEAVPNDYNKDYQRSISPFGPIVEKVPNGLITDYPENSTGIDIPVMIGFNSREGMEKSLQYFLEPRYLSFVEKDFMLIMPMRVKFRFDPLSKSYDDAVNDIKNKYFPNGKVTYENVPEYVTYKGDVFTYDIDYVAKEYSSKSSANVYYYYFDYYSDLNENKNDILRISTVYDQVWGAAAGDELCYLFKCPRLKEKYLKFHKSESEEIVIQRKMVRIWANFARHSNPTPEDDEILENLKWPPYNTESKEYLHIGKRIEVKSDLNRERFNFWDGFLEKWEQKAVNGIVVTTNNKDEL